MESRSSIVSSTKLVRAQGKTADRHVDLSRQGSLYKIVVLYIMDMAQLERIGFAYINVSVVETTADKRVAAYSTTSATPRYHSTFLHPMNRHRHVIRTECLHASTSREARIYAA